MDLPAVDAGNWDRVLDQRERARLGRFRRREDQERFLRAHVELRRILSDYTGIPLQQIEVSRACRICGHPAHGKPRLVGVDIDFSLSHAGDVAVVAATCGTPVGIDVEHIDRAQSIAASSELVFEDREATRLGTGPLDLVRAWTAKEAYTKACGLGLALDLTTIALTVGPVARIGLSHPTFGPAQATVRRIGDYVASVVVLNRVGASPSAGRVC